MIKNIFKFFTYSLLILLLVSCVHVQKSVSDTLPRESFIFLNKTLTVYSCGNDLCNVENFRSLASGFVVDLDEGGAYIVTAAHMCEDDVPPHFHESSKTIKTKSKYKAYKLNGESYEAVELTKDTNIDMCLMYVQGLIEDIEIVDIASTRPKAGDKIYNIAAPIGIYRPNMVPVLEGRYNGDANGVAWYSLLAAPGSSGSMIINEDGKLIGMVHSVYIRFPVITLSTTYDDMKQFITKNLKKYKLYKKCMDVLELKNVFIPDDSLH